MMSQEYLRKLGVLGIAFGLLASPLVVAANPEAPEADSPEQQQDAIPADPAGRETATEEADDPVGSQPSEVAFLTRKADNQFLVGDLRGQSIISAQEEDEEIGTVDDVLLNEDGEVVAITVGIGGFLGIGTKKVAIEWDALELTRQEGDYTITVNASREDLENAEAFDTSDADGPAIENGNMEHEDMETEDVETAGPEEQAL